MGCICFLLRAKQSVAKGGKKKKENEKMRMKRMEKNGNAVRPFLDVFVHQ